MRRFILYGGEVIHADEVVHGKTSDINHYESLIFNKIPSTFKATRYHSLVAKKDNLPKELKITAETLNGLIMAVEHRNFSVYGLQFHPESIVTDYGKIMIQNFIS